MTQTRMARTTNAPPLISSTTDELARQRIIAEDDEKEDEAPRGGGLGIGLEFRAQRRQRQALEWHTFSLPLTTRCSRLRRAPRRLTLARMIVVLTSYRRGLHLWLALGNVLLAASELHHSSCGPLAIRTTRTVRRALDGARPHSEGSTAAGVVAAAACSAMR